MKSARGAAALPFPDRVFEIEAQDLSVGDVVRLRRADGGGDRRVIRIEIPTPDDLPWMNFALFWVDGLVDPFCCNLDEKFVVLA